MTELVLVVCPICEKPISVTEGAEAWCSGGNKEHRSVRMVRP